MISTSKTSRSRSLIIIFLWISISSEGHCEITDMKIVEEPSSFGVNYPYGQGARAQETETLKLKVQPANFSGPPHFRRLVGRCFNAVIKDYKYKYCPFFNLTQHEQGSNWNPYNGVLGVWQEWTVENNTFISMEMKDGDSCGHDLSRSAKISFTCGNHSRILDVSEPSRCAYHLKFETPLVCHSDSMLVYPTLDIAERQAWDQLEGQFQRGEFTKKGYNKGLRSIFEKAGLLMTHNNRESLLKKNEEVNQDQMSEGNFESLDSCKAEFKKLQDELKELKAQLTTLKEHQNQSTTQESHTEVAHSHTEVAHS